jgi:pimeloyl-ACP methyl ester carboxylesterase
VTLFSGMAGTLRVARAMTDAHSRRRVLDDGDDVDHAAGGSGRRASPPGRAPGNYLPLLPKIRVPTLVNVGPRKTCTRPWALAEELHQQLSGSELFSSTARDTMPNLEAPDLVNERLEAWLMLRK